MRCPSCEPDYCACTDFYGGRMSYWKGELMDYPTATTAWFFAALEQGKNHFLHHVVMMTPEVAALLLQRNIDNRVLNYRNITQLKADILSGNWSFNGEPILISKNGLLNDGQHRLTAIVETGISIPTVVCFGLERESRNTVDQGTKRDAGDILTLDGMRNARASAAIATIIMRYESGDGTSLPIGRGITSIMVADRVKTDLEIQFCASYSQGHNRKCAGWLKPKILGAAYYLFRTVDTELAEKYISDVVNGENIKRGDPAFAVRAQLISLRSRTDANSLELVMRGWSAFVGGRELKLAKNMGSLPPLV